MQTGRVEGEVKRYFTDHRYGFLVTDDGETFFFREREWKIPIKPVRGLRVEFTPIEVDKGMRAVNITRIYRKKEK